MARLPVPMQHGAAHTRGTQEAGQASSEPSGRSNKNGSCCRLSNYPSEAGNSASAETGRAGPAAEKVRDEGKERRKSQQRGNECQGESLSDNSTGYEACGPPSGDTHVSSSNSGTKNKCNGRPLNLNKRSICQSSSKSVGRRSGSSCKIDTSEHVPRESSDDSSSDDEGDEIDLRAKTEEELCRQREQLDDSEEDESSEADECAVQASFGLFDPHERDEEAICCLLRQSVLRSNLKFSPSAMQQVAAAAAQQGNVGSVLKTIDDEVSGDEEESQQQPQKCTSDSASSSAGKGRKSDKNSASSSSATGIATGGRLKSDAHETEGVHEEGEPGTVVGFLTLLSFQQYPEVVAPFRKAILKLASEHASADRKKTLERIFQANKPVRESKIVDSKNSSRSANKTCTAGSDPGAQLSEFGDGAINCGWLLKERLSNTPPQLIPQMYDSLLEDISWSLSTEEMDEAERPFYAYSHVCGLTKVYKAGDGRDHSDTFKRHKAREALPFDTIFPHPEDELLVYFSSLTFAWPTGQSVRISLENDGVEASSASGAFKAEQTSPASRIRCCPEYLLFFVLPFEQFRRCKDAIAARAEAVTE